MARALARRREGFTHDVELDGGHTLVFDEPPDAGGADEGPSPTRALIGSLAACTAITVEMYADRKEWELGAVEVEVEAEYDGPVPVSFTVTLRVPEPLDEERQGRLLAIAAKCPVHRVIAGSTAVSISDRIECG